MGLCSELCLDPIGLVAEAEHLLCPRGHRWFSKEDCADDPPLLQLICHCLSSRDGRNLLPIHEEDFVYEIIERSFLQDCIPSLLQHGCFQPVQRRLVWKNKNFNGAPTPSKSLM